MFLFLDRDGVINMDRGYTYKFYNKLIYQDVDAISKLGFQKIFIVTNQSGIGRGYFTEEEFQKFMKSLILHLKLKFKIIINEFAYCPHDPTKECCDCRKPKHGLITRLIKKHDLDAEKCVLIGDRMSDICAAKSANIRFPILLDRYNTHLPDETHTKNFSIIRSLYGLDDVLRRS